MFKVSLVVVLPKVKVPSFAGLLLTVTVVLAVLIVALLLVPLGPPTGTVPPVQLVVVDHVPLGRPPLGHSK